jgi:hypothetical protein
MMLHQDGSRHAWLAGQAALDLIVTVDSELSCPVLVAHDMSASSGSVLLWAGWASRRLVHAVHRSAATERI